MVKDKSTLPSSLLSGALIPSVFQCYPISHAITCVIYMGVLGFDNCLVQELELQYKKSPLTRSLRRLRTTHEPVLHRPQNYANLTRWLRASTWHTLLAATNFEDPCYYLLSRTLDPAEKAFRNMKIDNSTMYETILGYEDIRIPRRSSTSHAAVLSNNTTKEIQESPLLDVALFSMGTETPVKFSLLTSSLGILILVFEVERAHAKVNDMLSIFEVSGITAALCGEEEDQDRQKEPETLVILESSAGKTGGGFLNGVSEDGPSIEHVDLLVSLLFLFFFTHTWMYIIADMNTNYSNSICLTIKLP
ncbi:hypothetical protein DL96DRAFT_1759114 [Flagelloscypha sp. PMI_526]|nr:hypothetical protein DL96DRAFT_1759114 [Flagelloscypha sp. PMI_526]